MLLTVALVLAATAPPSSKLEGQRFDLHALQRAPLPNKHAPLAPAARRPVPAALTAAERQALLVQARRLLQIPTVGMVGPQTGHVAPAPAVMSPQKPNAASVSLS